MTTLAYALLGLIQRTPLSGYALMRTFQTTPMGQYSGSPGAVYPALRKLETAKLIRGQIQERSSLRPRRVYRLTPRGRTALRRWLEPEVAPEDVERREPELMLRFALMEGVVPEEDVRRFLTSFARAIDQYIERLEPFLEAPGMSTHSTLALEGGLDGLRGRATWARRALRVVGRGDTRSITRRRVRKRR